MVDIKRMIGGALQSAPLMQQPGGPRQPWDEQIPGQMDPMGGGTQPQQQKPGFGNILSDFVINYGAASGNPLAGGIIQNRMRDQQQQAAQQARERMYQRQRSDRREDQQWAWDNKPKSEDPLTRDMIAAGIDPKSPEGIRMYRKSAEKRTAEYILVPDGRGGMISVQRPSMPAPPSTPVGKLTPINATTQNTPAPELGGNGMPTTLTRQQYLATVNAMGKEKTDAWVMRNNVRIGQ